MKLVVPRGRPARLRAVVDDAHGDPLEIDAGHRLSFTCSERGMEPKVSFASGVLDILFPAAQSDFHWALWIKDGDDVVCRVAFGDVRVLDG